MQFNSVDFMLFFPIVLGVYFVVPKRIRRIWLLIASYYFYMSWNVKYAALIGGSTIATYLSGLLIGKSVDEGLQNEMKGGSKKKKRLIVLLCIVINLGVLAVFKYGNFAIESVNLLLRVLGITTIQRRFDLLLPVGISFYTFQALGYIIDVYRGDTKAETNFLKYALFVSFFPQLVAGPIERSKNLLSWINNIENTKLWNGKRIASGAILMVWGLFMKMVISDRASLLVDTVFNNYRMYGSVELILAVIGFSIQIYCDFGGYSTIAIGAGKIIGCELMENFNTPYFSRNIRDFWSRWHISLSTWFRDYLYIPLGGNRRGIIRKNINLVIVFLVSGLWHGANWSFVVWGGIHGFYQVVANLSSDIKRKFTEKMAIKTDCLSWKILQTGITYALVLFAWIFFRSDTITDALRFVKRIFIRPTPWLLFNGGIYTLGLDRIQVNILIFAVVLLILVDFIRYIKKQTLDVFLMEQNIWFEWLVIIGLVIMIFVYGEYGPTFDAQQFIYFQF